jgi:uncharacterized protein YndB with AHSA1/START domain
MTAQRVVTAPEREQTIRFTREFDASAALVFRTHTDADLIGRWTGPRGTTVEVSAWDARTGGSYRYTVIAGDGREWPFHGSFHEVTPASRLVQTWEYEGEPGHPVLEVLTFTNLDHGRSLLEGQAVYLSVADRDAALGDFDAGRDEDFERLDDLLGELRQ